jgi:hypothetical protein
MKYLDTTGPNSLNRSKKLKPTSGDPREITLHHKKFNSDLEEELNQRIILNNNYNPSKKSQTASNCFRSNEANATQTPSTSGFVPTNRSRPRATHIMSMEQ